MACGYVGCEVDELRELFVRGLEVVAAVGVGADAEGFVGGFEVGLGDGGFVGCGLRGRLCLRGGWCSQESCGERQRAEGRSGGGEIHPRTILSFGGEAWL